MRRNGADAKGKRFLPHLKSQLNKVNALAEQMGALSDADLRALTDKLKERFRSGQTLDMLLPEAFAAIREASKRVLGMRPYDVQVLCAVALHRGMIAEMKTGEGKTLAATMPLYLHALTGESAVLVTMNAYLSRRDAHDLKPLYEFMGMRADVSVPEDESIPFTPAEKKRIYAADIVYTTHYTLGFDYLSEHLASSVEEQFLRPFSYCVIDEADAVLLDGAHTPLVISGAPRVQSNLYQTADVFVSMLKKGKDYEEKDGKAWLTNAGMQKAERFFGTQNLYESTHFETVRHLNLALKAHACFEKDEEYAVQDDKIKLLDKKSGRIIENTKLRGGQHQAIEAKEEVPVTHEYRAMASVTYQDFFALFPVCAGMTGAVGNGTRELRQIYGLRTVTIPTNCPCIRQDENDRVFLSEKDMLREALSDVCARHHNGQPVLVITDSIASSERISEGLLRRGVAHNVLNAYHIAREAAIIAEAGLKNAVTVATSVAGRGTDIRLDEEALKRGGLAVIGFCRMENRRLEIQARGRSGRQGDPGVSVFYVSAEDEVVKDFGAKWLKRYLSLRKALRLDEEKRDRPKKVSVLVRRQINKAQRISEEHAFGGRKNMMEYARSLRAQRNLLYETRDRFLRMEELDHSYLEEMFAKVFDDFLDSFPSLPDRRTVNRFLLDNVDYRMKNVPEAWEDRASLKEYLMTCALASLDRQEQFLENETAGKTFYRLMTVKAVDENWIEQVDYLSQLKEAIAGRQYAQRNPSQIYHAEAYQSFEKMVKEIRRQMMRNILLGEITRTESGELQVLTP